MGQEKEIKKEKGCNGDIACCRESSSQGDEKHQYSPGEFAKQDHLKRDAKSQIASECAGFPERTGITRKTKQTQWLDTEKRLTKNIVNDQAFFEFVRIRVVPEVLIDEQGLFYRRKDQEENVKKYRRDTKEE